MYSNSNASTCFYIPLQALTLRSPLHTPTSTPHCKHFLLHPTTSTPLRKHSLYTQQTLTLHITASTYFTPHYKHLLYTFTQAIILYPPTNTYSAHPQQAHPSLFHESTYFIYTSASTYFTLPTANTYFIPHY